MENNQIIGEKSTYSTLSKKQKAFQIIINIIRYVVLIGFIAYTIMIVFDGYNSYMTDKANGDTAEFIFFYTFVILLLSLIVNGSFSLVNLGCLVACIINKHPYKRKCNITYFIIMTIMPMTMQFILFLVGYFVS